MFETTVINPIHFKYKYSNIGGVCNYFGLYVLTKKKSIFSEIDHELMGGLIEIELWNLCIID